MTTQNGPEFTPPGQEPQSGPGVPPPDAGDTPQYPPAGDTQQHQPVGAGDTQQYPPVGTTVTDPAPPKKRNKLVVGVIAAVAALALIAGGIALAMPLLGGGGRQPDDVLPNTAAGYVRLDLNPSADQKLAAWNFLSKFPSIKEKLDQGSFSSDPRKALWEAFVKGNPSMEGFNYDTDVAPWLGDRIGVALQAKDTPGGSTLMAIQSKDHTKAQAFFTKVREKGGTSFATALEDYLIVAGSQEDADAGVAAAKQGKLSAVQNFRDDMGSLKGAGVMSVWMDLAAAAKASGSTMQAPTAQVSGRVVGAATFTNDSLDFNLNMRGLQGAVDYKGGDVTEFVGALPASSTGVLALADYDDALRAAWPELEKSPEFTRIKSAMESLGLTVPDDLYALLGNRIAVVTGIDLEACNISDLPVGVKVISDEKAATAAAWQKVAAVLEQQMGSSSSMPVAVDDSGDATIVSMNPSYGAQLAGGGAALKDDPDFVRATKADRPSASIVFVRPAKFDRTGNADLAVVKGVGVNSGLPSGGNSSSILRVIV